MLPILIPNVPNLVPKFFDFFQPDGVILTGGNNVDPVTYGHSDVDMKGDSTLLRDQTEFRMMEVALLKELPILGVCRGMQLINTFFGGCVSDIGQYPVNHVGQHHLVEILSSEKLIASLGSSEVTVNSYHNQGVLLTDFSKELIVFAESSLDHVIEGVCHKEYPVVGVQWHPEREEIIKPIDEIIVKELFLQRRIDFFTSLGVGN